MGKRKIFCLLIGFVMLAGTSCNFFGSTDSVAVHTEPDDSATTDTVSEDSDTEDSDTTDTETSTEESPVDPAVHKTDFTASSFKGYSYVKVKDDSGFWKEISDQGFSLTAENELTVDGVSVFPAGAAAEGEVEELHVEEGQIWYVTRGTDSETTTYLYDYYLQEKGNEKIIHLMPETSPERHLLGVPDPALMPEEVHVYGSVNPEIADEPILTFAEKWLFDGSSVPEQITGDWSLDSSSSALRSAPVAGGQTSSAVIYVKIPASGSLYYSFKHKESCEENYDELNFYIDGEEINSWSGSPAEFAFEPMDAVIEGTPGDVVTFKWEYEKDESDEAGDDCVYVTDILFRENPQFDLSYEDETPDLSLNLTEGESFSQNFEVIAAQGFDEYIWYLDGIELNNSDQYYYSFNWDTLNQGRHYLTVVAKTGAGNDGDYTDDDGDGNSADSVETLYSIRKTFLVNK